MNITKEKFVLLDRYLFDSDLMTVTTIEPERKESITLNRNETALLVHLLSQYPNVVYRNEMLEFIWKGRHVVDNSLNVVVSQLRGKLKLLDSALKESIVTAQGEGYRWRGTVTHVSSYIEPLQESYPGIATQTSLPTASHIVLLFIMMVLIIGMLFYS